MRQSVKNRRRRSFHPAPELLEGRQLRAASAALDQQLQAGSDGLQQALADDSVGFDSINYATSAIGTANDVFALGEQGNSAAAAAGGAYWTQAWSAEAATRSLMEDAYQTWLNGFAVYGGNNDTGGPWYQVVEQAKNEFDVAALAAYQADQLIAQKIADPRWTPPISSPSPSSKTPPTTTELQAKIVKFADGLVTDPPSQKVGDGNCTALVNAALAASGAKNANEFAPRRVQFNPRVWANFNYRWGNPVATLTPSSHGTGGIQPGDIIQYRDVLVAGNNNSIWWYQHHTSIVSKVSGSTITVVEQGIASRSYVQSNTLNLDTLQNLTLAKLRTLNNTHWRKYPGWLKTATVHNDATLWVYSPVAK